jgi:hypothetical protein
MKTCPFPGFVPVSSIFLVYSYQVSSRILRELSKNSGRILEELSKKPAKKCELIQNQYRRDIEEMTNCPF